MSGAGIELYGASSCAYTAELRERLEWEGRAFVEYDVETDSAARERLIALTGNRLVPALVEHGRVVLIGWHGRGCVV